jgi:uncharacterized protein YndB with AHSA1/START domain
MIPERIKSEIVIAAPVERVWAAVTEAGHVGTWFGDAGAEIDLRPGGTMSLSWKEHGTVRAVIEKVEPHSFFSYRWVGSIAADPVEGNSTLVEFTLVPEGGGTRLRVVESGFRELNQPEDVTTRYVDGNVEGWRIELSELQEYLER